MSQTVCSFALQIWRPSSITTGNDVNAAGQSSRSAVAGDDRLKSGSLLLADRGYDADWIRDLVRQHSAWANIPPKRNRTEALCFSPYLYRARNLVERFFNEIKHCRRVATRYDKLAANYPRIRPTRINTAMAAR
jgi:transposase